MPLDVALLRDATWLREWITAPDSVDPFARMPGFGATLTDDEMTAIVNFLAARKCLLSLVSRLWSCSEIVEAGLAQARL